MAARPAVSSELDGLAFLSWSPAIRPSPTATSLGFAGHDPVLHCVGVWDLALIGPAAVRSGSTPTTSTSPGAWKARYH